MGKYETISEITFIDIFADNLREIMKEVGITQSELADEAGLSRASINRYLNKQRMPDLVSLLNNLKKNLDILDFFLLVSLFHTPYKLY